MVGGEEGFIPDSGVPCQPVEPGSRDTRRSVVAGAAGSRAAARTLRHLSPLPQLPAKPWETTAHPGTVLRLPNISEAVAAPERLVCPCTGLRVLLSTCKP